VKWECGSHGYLILISNQIKHTAGLYKWRKKKNKSFDLIFGVGVRDEGELS
jgi:hypothetical protein